MHTENYRRLSSIKVLTASCIRIGHQPIEGRGLAELGEASLPQYVDSSDCPDRPDNSGSTEDRTVTFAYGYSRGFSEIADQMV